MIAWHFSAVIASVIVSCSLLVAMVLELTKVHLPYIRWLPAQGLLLGTKAYLRSQLSALLRYALLNCTLA